MRQPWFYARPEDWTTARVVLDAEETRHASRSLRVRPPDVITVIDGNGRIANCAVLRTEPRLEAEILESTVRDPVRPRVRVYQGASKGGKLDDVVEKLAELGVARMYGFASERSIARWSEEKIERLNQRWAAIARSAAKQSRNPHILEATAGLSWDELLVKVKGEPLALTLWEEASLPMRTALEGSVDSVALIVGPEGGFARSEAEALADAGAPLVSLGPNIMRTENAALVATSALLYHYGLIG